MELKKCPCCGGEAFITTGHIVALWEHKVMCCECGLQIARGGISPSHARAKAIEAWNRREPIDKIVEQLEDKAELTYLNKMEERVGKKQTTGFALGIRAAIEIVKGGGNE